MCINYLNLTVIPPHYLRMGRDKHRSLSGTLTPIVVRPKHYSSTKRGVFQLLPSAYGPGSTRILISSIVPAHPHR